MTETSAEGYGADIHFDGMTVTITGKGLGKGALGAASRSITLEEVTSTDFKDASMLTNGHLELVTAHGKTVVHFRRKQSDQMKLVYDAILAGVPDATTGRAKAPMANTMRDAQLEHQATVAEANEAAERDNLTNALELVTTFQPVGAAEALGMGVMLAKSESLYLELEDAACVEVRHAPGEFKSRNQGLSFRVTKGVSYRVGGGRGHYQPGPESPTAIDTGIVLITSERVIFRGSRESREWKLAKLTGVEDSDDASWTALPVTNRQKTSGIGYATHAAGDVRLRLQLALADFHGTRDHLAIDLNRRIAALGPPDGGHDF